MSRSYREPYWVDGYGSKRKKEMKRKASRAVRVAKNVPNGKAYKKEFCSWDIADYRFEGDPKDWKVARK